MSRKLPALLALLSLTAIISACADPLRIRATMPTVLDTLTVFALTGTSPSLPSALNVRAVAIVRADSTLGFDLAFDIRGSEIALLPIGAVTGQGDRGRRVGLQAVETDFDSLIMAPRRGYVDDSVLVVAQGRTVAVRVQSGACPAFEPSIYSKLVVDSIDTAARAIHFRVAVDPNCGFRSFAPGIPGS